MVKKQIQRHDFLNGGPVKQYIFDFNGDDTITIGGDNNINFITAIDNPFTPEFILNNNSGDNIFVVNENQLRWRGSDLVTEARFRELVLEIMSGLRSE